MMCMCGILIYLFFTFLNLWCSDQRALWCIQLERDYHQRVLDNLNALQQQWGNTQRTHLLTCRVMLVINTFFNPKHQGRSCDKVVLIIFKNEHGDMQGCCITELCVCHCMHQHACLKQPHSMI